MKTVFLSMMSRIVRILSASLTVVTLLKLVCLSSLALAQSSDQRKLENTQENQQSGGRRVALVIGNANYVYGKLKNPIHDANDMTAFLRSAGFEVIERNDLTEEEMEQAVKKFGEKIKGASVALFYYSGHGVQAKGVNFLVPVTHNIHSESDIVLQAMPLHRVFEQFESAKTTVNLMLLDACRNDPFDRSFKDLNKKGLAEVSAPKGTLIAFAAAPGQTSSDNPTGRNGLWTQEFLKVAQQSGQELRDILDTAGAAVEQASKDEQVPWSNSSLRKKVVFLGKGKQNGGDEDLRRTTLLEYGIETISIPAGPFLMGDNNEFNNPRHTVTLSGYSISKNLITVKQYMQFVHATNRSEPKSPRWGWKDDHPIVNVRWEDADDYCKWLSAKTGLKVMLPTEAQWEKAARGRDGRKYPWGNEWDGSKCANSVNRNNLKLHSTMPVGRFPSGASPYGVLDMSGNVWQWCRDWYDQDYPRIGPKEDPQGTRSGGYHVYRGGSWDLDFTDFFRSTARQNIHPASFGYEVCGFRVVSEP